MSRLDYMYSFLLLSITRLGGCSAFLHDTLRCLYIICYFFYFSFAFVWVERAESSLHLIAQTQNFALSIIFLPIIELDITIRTSATAYVPSDLTVKLHSIGANTRYNYRISLCNIRKRRSTVACAPFPAFVVFCASSA